MNAVLDEPHAGHLIVKLAMTERERLQALAARTNKTPHFLMCEAIQTYLDKAELDARFIDLAQQSLRHYQTTGSHISLAQFSAWTAAIQTDTKAVLAPCHG